MADPETDRQRLEKFFKDIHRAMDSIVESIDEFAPSMDGTEGDKQALKAAWQEWNDGGTVADHLEEILQSLDDDRIVEHGLTGKQLAFKLRIFDESLKTFERVRLEVPRVQWWARLGGLFGRSPKAGTDKSSTEVGVR